MEARRERAEPRPEVPECRRRGRQRGQDGEGLGHLVAGHVQVAVISPPPDSAITGVPPRARGGTVVRIWRLPPVS